MFHYYCKQEIYVTDIFITMQTAALKDHIVRHFNDLSPQLRRAARYVSDNPEDVATRSLRQVARKSGLTPPTYSRLARAIGFEHYEDLRDSCRNELHATRLSLAERAALLHNKTVGDHPDSIQSSFAAILASSAVSNIQKLLDDLDVAQLAEVADHLVKADNVYLIGSLSSRTMVEYLAYVAQMAVKNWRVVGQGTSSVPATLSEIGKKDVVLAIAVAPYASETVRAVQFASEAGACVITITDDLLSPTLKHAKFSFLTKTESLQFFPSHVALVTLLEIIMGMVVRRLGEKGQKRINAVEQSNHVIGDYWQQ